MYSYSYDSYAVPKQRPSRSHHRAQKNWAELYNAHFNIYSTHSVFWQQVNRAAYILRIQAVTFININMRGLCCLAFIASTAALQISCDDETCEASWDNVDGAATYRMFFANSTGT